MTVEIPENAPKEVTERVEKLHEFTINELRIAPSDVNIVAEKNPDEFWTIRMDQYPNAGTRARYSWM